MSGGVEGLQGEILAAPSDFEKLKYRAVNGVAMPSIKNQEQQPNALDSSTKELFVNIMWLKDAIVIQLGILSLIVNGH